MKYLTKVNICFEQKKSLHSFHPLPLLQTLFTTLNTYIAGLFLVNNKYILNRHLVIIKKNKKFDWWNVNQGILGVLGEIPGTSYEKPGKMVILKKLYQVT